MEGIFPANLRHIPGACLQRLRKTTRNLRLFSFPALSQRAHTEYDSEMLQSGEFFRWKVNVI